MKILFVTYFLPPIASAESIQTGKVLRGLLKTGCEITVLTASGSNLYARDQELDHFVRGIDVVSTPVRENQMAHHLMHVITPFLIYKPDAMRRWGLGSIDRALDLAQSGRYDLLITRAQPFSSHLIGLTLKRKLGIPWIAHFSDPLAENPFYYNFWINPHRKYNIALEAEVASEADEIHVVSEEMAQSFRVRYRDVPVKVVPHCYEKDLYAAIINDVADGQIRIMHSGTFTGRRNPACFLRALQLLRERNPRLAEKIRVEFCGPVAGRYRRLVNRLKQDGIVRYMGQVGYLTSLRRMQRADWLLLIDADFDGQSQFFPSKLVDYIGAAKPILALTPIEGASARILREAGVRRTVNPDNQTGIAEYLEETLSQCPSIPQVPAFESRSVAELLRSRCEEVARMGTKSHAITVGPK